MTITSATNIYQINNQNNNTSNTKINNNKDYLNMKFEDIKKLSYDEVKSNLTTIKENIQNKLSSNLSDKDALAISSYSLTQLGYVDYAKNTTYNKAMFNTMNSIDDPFQAIVFSSEIASNLTDYANNKNIEASFVVESQGEDFHSKSNLTQKQLNNINFDSFISKMLKTFTQDLQNSTNGKTKEQYQAIVDGYSLLQQNYNQAKSEPIYA
jgi:hypothetical protein